MSLNFRELLNFSSDDVDRPKALPKGTYVGTIQSHEFGESKNKGTPYVRFILSVEEADIDVDKTKLNGVDLSTITLGRDYYITDKAKYRLCDMLDNLLGKDPRVVEERIPDTHGAKVRFTVGQRPSDQGSDFINDVDKITKA